MGFDENKKPKLAQWNYRILCHPLSKDLPTSHLKPIMDPHSQKMNGWNDEKFLDTRAIRFNIEGIKSILKENSVLKRHPKFYIYQNKSDHCFKIITLGSQVSPLIFAIGLVRLN